MWALRPPYLTTMFRCKQSHSICVYNIYPDMSVRKFNGLYLTSYTYETEKLLPSVPKCKDFLANYVVGMSLRYVLIRPIYRVLT